MKALSVLAFACAANSQTPDQADLAMLTATTILTATAPQTDVPLKPFASAPSTLALSITRIDNPSLQGFSVHALVAWIGADGGTQQQDLGTVTPFPSDQPGTFMLSVPAAAKLLLVRKDGSLRLRLSLVPITPTRPLVEPLKVTFGDPVWH
jgi:hypothetical protein